MMASISRNAPVERQGETLGVAQSAGSLARITGPAVAGFLFEHVSPSAAYVTAAGVLGAVGLATWRRYRQMKAA